MSAELLCILMKFSEPPSCCASILKSENFDKEGSRDLLAEIVGHLESCLNYVSFSFSKVSDISRGEVFRAGYDPLLQHGSTAS
jgi:hypothetical protein